LDVSTLRTLPWSNAAPEAPAPTAAGESPLIPDFATNAFDEPWRAQADEIVPPEPADQPIDWTDLNAREDSGASRRNGTGVRIVEAADGEEPWVTPIDRAMAEALSEEASEDASFAGRPLDASSEDQEAQPDMPSRQSEEPYTLPASLETLFRKKVVTNPYVKALLQEHGTVNARELADDLRSFAISVGASNGKEQA
jgi:hypothetical protein